MQEEFDRVLDQFREGFRADGFEVAVIEVKPGGVVVVQIQHRPEACEECLIPDDMLTAMFRTAMQRVLPEVTAVELCHEAAG
jgi:Fe-S cluster biogenesis protein NfuA